MSPYLAAQRMACRDAITSDREEHKFVLPRRAVASFVREVGERLPHHRSMDDGASEPSVSAQLETGSRVVERVCDAVVEVKFRNEHPPWLAELLARLPLEAARYRKFLHAGLAVHGIG